jgi:ubiquinone/menaquinone biosynthesis C-methylase UbiE
MAVMNRQAFLKIYWKLQSIITPGLKYSQSIYEEVLNENCAGSSRWLDLGCGHHLLPPWRLEQEKELTCKAEVIVGVDYDYLSLTKHKTIRKKVRGDISKLPFSDNSFNLVTSNMVFEHLDNPERQLKEIARVLTKGGKLIFHTPNALGYATLFARMIPEFIKKKFIYLLEGRKEEDVFVTHYKINTPSQIKRLAKLSGFSVSEIRMICSSAQFVVLPPIVFLELIWIRFLMSKAGKPLRTDIIAILEKA